MPAASSGPGAPATGASPPTRVGRIGDRGTFDALRRRGRSGRSGPVRVVRLAPGPHDRMPRAAYSVPRRAGTAVIRNRIRRRLRAALADLGARGELPGGSYLLHGAPELAELPWPVLLRHVGAAVERAARRESNP